MAISLTEKAAAKIKELISSQNNQGALILRFGIRGGGCSGLEYRLEFIPPSTVEQHDRIFESHNVTIVVDPKSYPYIIDSVIDYREVNLTGGFAVENPNADSHCGCGTSFSPQKQPKA